MSLNFTSFHSQQHYPYVKQIRDVEIDTATLATGHYLAYNSADKKWENTPSSAGSVVGTDDAATFKSGTNANAYNDGITRNPALANYTINLDPVNKRVGIGGANNAQNPTNTLEVDGTQRLKTGAEELVLNANSVGLINAGTNLKLYSDNDNTDEANTQIDGTNKACIVGGTLQVRDNAVDDIPTSAITDGLFRLSLRRGYNRDLLGLGIFDAQRDFNTALGFPTSQKLTWLNKLPLINNRLIGRVATGVSVAAGANYLISSLGTQSGIPSQDRMVYDPCNMRTRLTGITWTNWGLPVKYRQAGIKGTMNVKIFFDGEWLGADVNNRVIAYVNHYSNGVFVRSYNICDDRSIDNECIMSGERTIMGYSASLGESIDPVRDDFDAYIVNQSPVSSLQVNLGQIEASFTLTA